MQKKGVHRARTVHQEMKHCSGSLIRTVVEMRSCPGNHGLSGPARMICPGSQCHDERETEFFPVSRET